ncbi:hypothetical protein GGR22_001619 [Flavobacterium gossypii]|uniref:Carboxypeptidase regulatory-like domain-containing protein n=1 Tax=Flavobacterium gossypii TaxID=1646119 RepID=A0ABR6DPZ6_9FLAO|nr:hypothetical protein [Flavobacterium gossypii]MBA9073493.1 hypothetical protein [Flavobacterium gossypii]
MKISKYLLFVFALLLGSAVYSQEIIYPKTAFDQAAAKKALEKGKSSISGFVFSAPRNGFGIKHVNERTYGKYKVVSLFPLTPYMEEWKKLRTRLHNTGKKIVKMSKEADATRIDVETDEGGNFTFKDLKPGKYLLISEVSWHYAQTDEDPEENIYVEVYGTAEIKTDGEKLTKVKVTN